MNLQEQTISRSMAAASCIAMMVLASIPAAHGESHFFSTTDAASRLFNGGAYFSLAAAEVFVARDQARTTPFGEMTLGAWATGTESTTGRVEPYFVPGASPARVEFRFLGSSINRDGVARHQKRDISIHSTSQSSLDVRKPILLDERGLTLLPVEGCVRTDLNVHCIEANNGVMRWLAGRRVDKQQGEAEAIKSRKLREQVGAELETEVAKQLAQPQKTFEEKIRKMLVSRNAFPRLSATNTGEKRLEMRLLHQNAGQLAPPLAPGSLPTSYDMGLVIHESLLGNMAESMWGGQKVTDEQLLTFVKTATGRPPRELWVHDRTPRWSLTLTDKLPVTGEFRSGRLKATLRCKGATRDEEALDAPFQATATYQPFITFDGPRLVREGEVEFAFTDEQPETAERRDWQAFLSRKMSGLFQEEINFDGLTPPSGGAGDNLKRFRLAYLDSNREWIGIGYKLYASVEAAEEAALAQPQ
jgi:hypothetical protein